MTEPHDRSDSAEPHGKPKCGARAKQTGQDCKRPAGWGTDHPGQGRCRFHGGATPIKHGRYSAIKREDFKERIERFRADPDPLNLADEIAMLRAFLEDWIDRWDDIFGPDGALLAWFESYNDPNKPVESRPRQMLDFATLTQLVDRVGRMVERIHKMQQQGSISLGTLERYVEQLGIEVVEVIREATLDQDQSDKILGGIEDRWRSIKLGTGRNSG